MIDEITENPMAAEPVPAPIVEPKKERAPRRSKAEIEAALADKKNSRGGRARSAGTKATSGTAVSVGRASGARFKGSKRATTSAPAGTDEFTDILQLEAENKRLRESLAEKLRAENADLRKKLGIS